MDRNEGMRGAAQRMPASALPFSVTIGTPDGNRLEIHLAGELDVTTSDHLERSAATVIAGGSKLVVLDLADLSFIDSSGVRALVRTRNLLLDGGIELRLRSVRPQVRRVLRVCGVDVLFPELGTPKTLD